MAKSAKEIPELTEKDKRRFYAKVDRQEGEDGCWLWSGKTTNAGYGRFSIGGSSFSSHRVSFTMHGGVFVNGPLVCHGPCNRKLCVNPNHLSSGNPKSNMLDKIRDGTISKGDSHREKMKGKAPTGDRNGARLHPERLSRGEKHSEIMRRVAARGERCGAYTHPEKVLRGDNHPSRLHPELRPRGEAHGRAKITELQVLEIRKRCADGQANFAQMGREYGVSGVLIRKIKRRDIWKHIA